MAIKKDFICTVLLFLHFSSKFSVISWVGNHNDALSIKNSTFVRTRSRVLDGQRNLCPVSCKCSFHPPTFVKADCSNRNLNTFPTDIEINTKKLLLNGNNLTKLELLPHPLLNLQTLDVANNNISHIKKEFVSNVRALHYLNMSQNLLHSSTLENVLGNLSVLSVLNISENKLNKLSPSMFQGLVNLKVLDVSRNNITIIENHTFRVLGSLQYLDLSWNRITLLRHQWFHSLMALSTLRLNRNKVKNINNLIFSPLLNLDYIDLSENNILSIGSLSFKGLSNLKYLNCSFNNISIFQEGILRQPNNLETFDLSYNPIVSMDNIFKYSQKIKFLKVENTRLKHLSEYSLIGLSNLQQLRINHSPYLSSIDRNAFLPTPNLVELDMSDSNISTLPSGLLHTTTELKMLKLDRNPWKCDCYMHWLLTWLQDQTDTHLFLPDETLCENPSKLYGHALLDALDHHLVCTNATIREYSSKAHFHIGSTALLQCQVEGNPSPLLTWVTPHNLVFHWSERCCNGSNCNDTACNLNHPLVHNLDNRPVTEDIFEKFLLLQNGNLLIKNIYRRDSGYYHCIASNPMSNQTVSIHLTLDHGFMNHIKIVSILVGLATSFGFLLLTLVSVFVQLILRRCGIECPCSTSPKTRQIKSVLDGMEHYKRQQLERLRENYNFQVQRIKENCMQQMERLRESYSAQIERLRDIRDYGTLQIDRIRENYYLQVQRVRDYSASQIDRLRENYFFQRSRIRKFSAHKLYKLRENYKLQQQHLNKILENLNIESCRNVCARTDSIIFEPEITVEPIFMSKICTLDSGENSSQNSAYFTPDEAGSEISASGEVDMDPAAKLGDACKLAEDVTAIDVKLDSRVKEPCSEVPDVNCAGEGKPTEFISAHPGILIHHESETSV